MKNRILKVWPEVLKVAWPLVIANSFWNIQLTIDRVFLGQYSTEALGAAMAVFGVFWAPMALVQQTAAYVSTFVAQYFGAQKLMRIGPAVWQSVYVSIVGGLLFLLLIPLSPSVFRWMGHSEALQFLESQYFSSICYSALPTALVATASGYYTGLGRTSMIMWINGTGMILNIIFDYLLIFGKWGFPALGVEGAGYATAIANFGAALFAFAVIFFKEGNQFSLREGWRFDFNLMKRFLKYGLPSGLQWALEGLAFTVFLLFIGRMQNGAAALAASGIAVAIMFIAILPPLGIGQAVSVLVGQYLGGNQTDRAERVSYIGLEIAVIYILMVGSTFWMFPEFYLNWFHNSGDPEIWTLVSRMVPNLLLFVATFTAFDAMNIIFSFALRGAGDTRFVTAVALIVPWPIMVLPTWWAVDHPQGLYWAWGFASVFIITQAVIFWRRFAHGKWKLMRVIEQNE